MARILGIDIPNEKRGEVALTYIFGIGKKRSNLIFEKASVDKNKRVIDWSDEETKRLREIINKYYKIEGELKAEIRLDIKRLIDIGCYRGKRHRLGLPTRGQKTKNNARTRKGKRKTVANKKKATK